MGVYVNIYDVCNTWCIDTVSADNYRMYEVLIIFY